MNDRKRLNCDEENSETSLVIDEDQNNDKDDLDCY